MPKKPKIKVSSECVKVIVRIRPLNKKEKNIKAAFILDFTGSASITIKKPNDNNRRA